MFKTVPDNIELSNKFIKHDSQMLNNVYGSDDVSPYWIADMDFPIASPITQAMQHLVSRETFSYEFDSQTVFESIANWNRDRHGLMLNSKHFVQVPGVLSAIALLIREFTNEGDGILIQTPVYHQFRRLIESAGRTAVNNTLNIGSDRYVMNFELFEEQLASGEVSMILLCNPHNPVGRVWSKEELAKLVELAEKYDVIIISDEVHGDVVFDGAPFTSITEFDYANTLTIIGSPAKNFGLNSISNGYIYSDNDTLREKIKATSASLAVDHGNAFTTYATIAAYQQGKEWFDGFLNYTQSNRDWILDYVARELPKLRAFKPEGTNQIWFDFSGYELEGSQLKTVLVDQAKMALTPGTWFGEPNENFYRMNFAVPLEKIKHSFELLKSALDNPKSCGGETNSSNCCCG